MSRMSLYCHTKGGLEISVECLTEMRVVGGAFSKLVFAKKAKARLKRSCGCLRQQITVSCLLAWLLYDPSRFQHTTIMYDVI